jgi:hypothetical protein
MRVIGLTPPDIINKLLIADVTRSDSTLSLWGNQTLILNTNRKLKGAKVKIYAFSTIRLMGKVTKTNTSLNAQQQHGIKQR